MIDRLEELLEQVEQPEGEAELTLTLPGRPGSLPRPAAGTDGEEEAAVTARPLSGQEEEGQLRAVSGPAAPSALPGLYRRLVRSAGEIRFGTGASAAMAAERPGEEAPSLTPGELDRVMRRDSRRYDGGMTMY